MAVEDLTTWTEENDTGSWLTVTATSVVWDDLPRDRDAQLVKAHNETGDFTHKFEFTTAATGETSVDSWVYPYVIRDTNIGPDIATGDALALYYVKNATGIFLVLRLREAGADADFEVSTGLSYSTKYFITITRDDDAGANSTGQSVCYICTGDYNGEVGATLIDTLTVDSAAGEQNDYAYVQLARPRGSGGTAAQDGTVENVDFGEAAPSYQDAEGTFAIALSFSGTAEAYTGYQDAEGTFAIALTFSGTGTVVSGTISGGPGTQTKRRLVAIGNNVLYYEDI